MKRCVVVAIAVLALYSGNAQGADTLIGRGSIQVTTAYHVDLVRYEQDGCPNSLAYIDGLAGAILNVSSYTGDTLVAKINDIDYPTIEPTPRVLIMSYEACDALKGSGTYSSSFEPGQNAVINVTASMKFLVFSIPAQYPGTNNPYVGQHFSIYRRH
ncbi:MAG TPA: hypothetical protein VGB83_07170 [Actinomycetota bacterium]